MSFLSIRRFLSSELVLTGCCLLGQSTTPLENDQVKVISAFEKPFVRTPLHEHKLNRVMIYEVAGTQEFMDMHKVPYTVDFKAGEVKWSPAGGMHMARVITPTAVPMVELEVKDRGKPAPFIPSALDPVKVDPKHYRVEFENTQVRVLRVTIGPHESTPLHEHALNRVIVYLSGQDFRVTPRDGKPEHMTHSAGEISWGGPAIHKEENLSDKPFEVVVTEFKN